VTLYDPTNPVLRPKLLQYIERHKTASYNLRSSQCDFTDITDNIVSTESYCHINLYIDLREIDVFLKNHNYLKQREKEKLL